MPVMSMTGFGRHSAQGQGRVVTVELKGVNHRFLDISFRMPRAFNEFEDDMRKAIQARLGRGHVDVYLKYENTQGGEREVRLNEGLLKTYLAAAEKAAKEYKVKNDVTMSALLAQEEVFTTVAVEEDAGVLKGLLDEALGGALDAIALARQAEGGRLKDDILAKLNAMEGLRLQVEARAPVVVEEYRQRLTLRVAELLQAGGIDENRLGAEIAMFAEKSAIDEELVRLKSHLEQTRATLLGGGNMGRQLDFLVQEMNREVNTICSKSQDAEVTSLGLELKAEVEKIREQVQNIA